MVFSLTHHLHRYDINNTPPQEVVNFVPQVHLQIQYMHAYMGACAHREQQKVQSS